jgi:hypothetical protein
MWSRTCPGRFGAHHEKRILAMIPNADRCCLYEIEEQTRQERVAVGSNGRILRWQPNGNDDQKWLLVPVSADKCLIVTVATREYMSVGSNGDVLRWNLESDLTPQVFSFVNHDNSDDTWNIQESTKDEYVAVGGNGGVLRWSWTGRRDQRFRLIPVTEQPRPSAAPGRYQPGAIPDVPRLTGFDYRSLPMRSPSYLIGEAVIPATVVNDPAFGDAVTKVMQNPYYILRREQLWDRSEGANSRGYLEDHPAGAAVTLRKTITHGITQTDQDSVERTIAAKMTVGGNLAFKVPIPNIGEISGGISVASEITNTLKVTATTATQVVDQQVEDRTIMLPDLRMIRVGWSIVDRYEVRRADGGLVSSWEVALPGIFVEDSFQ